MISGRQDFGKLAEDVIEAAPCMLEMPAGTGKTHLLVTIAGKFAEHGASILVLTHTNAGVSAIRSRCLRLGVNLAQLSVVTISSWAERAALAYCRTSGHDPASDRWQRGYYSRCVNEAMELLGYEWFASIVGASYQALLVDEYQDCNFSQHLLVRRLAELVPCTVCFGDALQRIFDFPGEDFPDWDNDVRMTFPTFDGVRPYPYRWIGRNAELGEWLTYDVRQQLSQPSGRLTIPSDVMGLQYATGLSKNQRELFSVARALSFYSGDSLVICPNLPVAKCIKDARILGLRYSYVEEIEGKFIKQEVDAFLQAKTNGSLGGWLVALIKQCCSGLGGALDKTFREALDRGDEVDRYLSSKKRAPYAALLRAIGVFSKHPGISELRSVDFALKRCRATLFRQEAWNETVRTIIEAEQSGEEPSVVLESLRSLTKYSNVRFNGNVVSRTLLVKGLEFSNVLVTHASEKNKHGRSLYSRENLYVALTRATNTLWIQG